MRSWLRCSAGAGMRVSDGCRSLCFRNECTVRCLRLLCSKVQESIEFSPPLVLQHKTQSTISIRSRLRFIATIIAPEVAPRQHTALYIAFITRHIAVSSTILVRVASPSKHERTLHSTAACQAMQANGRVVPRTAEANTCLMCHWMHTSRRRIAWCSTLPRICKQV